jgi:hypothetical protein
MSGAVEHTVQERVTNSNDDCDGGGGERSIVVSQLAHFRLAPLPEFGFVPRRFGFPNTDNIDRIDANSSSCSSSAIAATNDDNNGVFRRDDDTAVQEEYVPVTRSSRLALPATFTTTYFQHNKAVKKNVKSLVNGDFQGIYDFKRSPATAADQFGNKTKDGMRLKVGVVSPADGTTIILHVTLEGYAVLDTSDGTWNRKCICKQGTAGIDSNEPFSNALTLDEMEFLAYRVLHLFLRALASEIPSSFLYLKEAFAALNQYYSRKRFFEQSLDLFIIKADLDVGMMAMATNHTDTPYAQDDEGDEEVSPQTERINTLISLAKYSEATGKVARSYGSILMTMDGLYAYVRCSAGTAFWNGQAFKKAQDHMVAAWHALCSNDNNSSSSTSVGGLDINRVLPTSIFWTLYYMYIAISNEKSRSCHGQRSACQRYGTTAGEDQEIVEVFPLLTGLLYTAGFQARSIGEISKARFLALGSRIERIGIFRDELDQPSALNILIQAGARPNAKHFHQVILQSKKRGCCFTWKRGYCKTSRQDNAKAVETIQPVIRGIHSWRNMPQLWRHRETEWAGAKLSLSLPQSSLL